MSNVALALPSGQFARGTRRLLVAAAALVIVASCLGLLSTFLGLGSEIAPAPRNPFGTGLREAAPSASGLGSYILAVQGQFYRSLTTALSAVGQDGVALWSLVAVSFLYGVFHAAGPGHGKAVVAGYLFATKRTLLRGLGLSLAAALLQAVVAIALVLVLRVALDATAASMSAATGAVEIVSFAALVVFGLALLWRKTALLVPSPAAQGAHTEHHHGYDHHHHGHGSDHESCGACSHVHMAPAAAVERLTTWRESAGVVAAAGLRPCSGAIIILVLAAAQNILAIGVVATIAMALGTAITTGALAAIAVFAKRTALRLAAGRGAAGAAAVAGLEVLAAALVALLGAVLVLGLWTGGAAS